MNDGLGGSFIPNWKNAKILTQPTAEPVTTAQAKSHLRIESGVTDDDTIIGLYITAARKMVEQWTGRSLMTQTWQYFLDYFPIDEARGQERWWDGSREGAITQFQSITPYIELPWAAPLVSITHLKTYDENDSATTFSSTNYFADINQEPGRLTLRSGSSWPSGIFRQSSGIEIQYVTGYSSDSDASDVPEDLKQAIKVIVAHLYEHRGDNIVGQGAQNVEMPNIVRVLLQPYVVRFL